MPHPIDTRIDPEGKRLPIKLDSTSNGEFVPVPLSPANHAANRLAHEYASRFSKHLKLDRRRFLVSACGAASTLLAFNAANAAAATMAPTFVVAVARWAMVPPWAETSSTARPMTRASCDASCSRTRCAWPPTSVGRTSPCK